MPYLSWDARRRKIIDAAIDVIAEVGVASMTTRRIAERAETSLGSLHYCFRNKAELIQLISEKGSEMLTESFADVDPDRGLEDTIRDSIEALWDWYRDNIGLQLALTELGLARIRRGGDPERVYRIWDRFGRDLLTRNIQAAAERRGEQPEVPIDEIVRFIIHRFDGLTLEYAASRDEAACERQVRILADAMVRLAKG